MKAYMLTVTAVTLLSGCVSAPQTGTLALRPFPDSPDPIVDTAKLPPERLSSFQSDKLECRRMQEKAMPISVLDAFGSSNVKAYERRREDQAAAIMRACLSGRGYMVLN